MKRMMAVVVMGMLSFLCVLGSSRTAQADDFRRDLEEVISMVPDGADTGAMGNASTALTSDYSTRNPGAIDATDYVPRNKAGVSVTYGHIAFKNGPKVDLTSVSALVRLPVGTLQAVFSDGGSDIRKVDQFNTIRFDRFPTGNVQYGARFIKGLLRKDDELFAGLGYAYGRSKLTIRQFDEGAAFLDATSKATTNMVEAGMLYRVANVVNFGVHFFNNRTASTDVSTDFTDASHSETNQLRFGISVKATPMTLVSFDYRHIYPTKDKDDDQYLVGIEQYVIKDKLALYGGWANGGLTAGVGVYFKNGGLNIAHVHEGLGLSEDFLGKADIWMGSAFLNF